VSSTTTIPPTRSTNQFTEPTVPDYAVPNAEEAWERMGRLVGKVLDAPKSARDIDKNRRETPDNPK